MSAGDRDLGAKHAAKAADCTVEEVRWRWAHGQKWCGACRRWLRRETAFGSNRSRRDGLSHYCRGCTGRQQSVYKAHWRRTHSRCRDGLYRCEYGHWGNVPHLHCPAPDCGRPMALNARRCEACETLKMLRSQHEAIRRNLAAGLGEERALEVFSALVRPPRPGAQRLPSVNEDFDEWHRQRKMRRVLEEAV